MLFMFMFDLYYNVLSLVPTHTGGVEGGGDVSTDGVQRRAQVLRTENCTTIFRGFFKSSFEDFKDY